MPTGLCLLRESPLAPRCEPNRKHAPQAKAPGQVNGPLSQKIWAVFQSATVQCPGVIAGHELHLQSLLLQPQGTQERKSLWAPEPGHQGSSPGQQPKKLKQQKPVSPLLEILVLWNMADGGLEDSSHPPRPLKKITVRL